jgi:hypothetical protein
MASMLDYMASVLDLTATKTAAPVGDDNSSTNAMGRRPSMSAGVGNSDLSSR